MRETSGSMKREQRPAWMTAVLCCAVVSLIFNIVFALAYVRVRSVAQRLQTSEGRLELMVKHLKLDERQTAQFRQAQADIRAIIEQAMHANQQELDTFWAELASNHPDQARLDTLLEHFATERTAMNQQLVRRLVSFLPTLTPPQRQACLEVLRHKRPRSLFDE